MRRTTSTVSSILIMADLCAAPVAGTLAPKALRGAMVRVFQSYWDTYPAHPAVWGPFVVTGRWTRSMCDLSFPRLDGLETGSDHPWAPRGLLNLHVAWCPLPAKRGRRIP